MFFIGYYEVDNLLDKAIAESVKHLHCVEYEYYASIYNFKRG